MKHRMIVEYSNIGKYNPNHKEKTYGFESEEQLKYFERGIEAVSFEYGFDYKIKEKTTHI